MCLIKSVGLHVSTGYFPFLVGYKYAQKDSERLLLQVVSDKFLHKKINNKDVYMDCGAAEDIPGDASSLQQYEDLTALNRSR